MASDGKDIRRELDLSSICDGNMVKLLTSHLQAVGVPKEYIFFPLLSTVSSFMGQSMIRISEEWTERCSLWTAVVARKGSKRSAVLDRFMVAILESGRMDQGSSPGGQTQIPLGVDVTWDEELTSAVYSEGKRHLGIFEDLTTSNLMERTSLRQAKRSYDSRPRESGTTTRGSLSVFSFLPPEDALALLEDKNVDLSSRFLVACPKSSLFKSSDIKTPMPSNTPSLSRIFEVINLVHVQPLTYTFSPQAKVAFDGYYDVLQDGMVRFDKDERNYCILAKAAGQLARLTACLAVLRQALKVVVYHETVSPANWNVEINAEDIEAGKLIMDYVIDIRFTLLSRVSAFKAQQMYPATGSSNQQANMNVGQVFMAREEPPAKRARVAPADTVQSPMVANSVTANEIPDSNQVSVTIRQNPAAAKQAQRPPHNSSQQQSTTTNNQLPGFNSTFVGGGNSSAYGMGYGSATVGQGDYVPTQGYFSTCPVSDEKYYLPGRRNTGYMDFSNLSQDEMDGYTEEQQKFVRRFGYKVKKLLEYRPEYRISPSCCAQRHLMPPIPKTEMARYDTQTRYPVIAAKEYLGQVADLGFGTIESTWHATNNRRSIIFNKHTYDKLTARARNLMNRLQIDVNEYMSAFLAPIEDPDYANMPSPVAGQSIQMDGQISSSSMVYPVPYPCLQQPSGADPSRESILTIFPEHPEASSESSPINSESSSAQQAMVKTEPMEHMS